MSIFDPDIDFTDPDDYTTFYFWKQRFLDDLAKAFDLSTLSNQLSAGFSSLSTFVGLIPGVGAAVANWLSNLGTVASSAQSAAEANSKSAAAAGAAASGFITGYLGNTSNYTSLIDAARSAISDAVTNANAALSNAKIQLSSANAGQVSAQNSLIEASSTLQSAQADEATAQATLTSAQDAAQVAQATAEADALAAAEANAIATTPAQIAEAQQLTEIASASEYAATTAEAEVVQATVDLATFAADVVTADAGVTSAGAALTIAEGFVATATGVFDAAVAAIEALVLAGPAIFAAIEAAIPVIVTAGVIWATGQVAGAASQAWVEAGQDAANQDSGANNDDGPPNPLQPIHFNFGLPLFFQPPGWARGFLPTVFFDPLVVNLNGTGAPNLTNVNNSTTTFDYFGNGFKTQTGWIASGAGLLAYDPSGTGNITAANLMGSPTQSGVDALRALDSNGDGIINASDPAYASLGVWIDSNADGVSQPGEFKSLASLGITSIDLNSFNTSGAVAFNDNGNQILATGTAALANGTTDSISEVNFQVNTTNSTFTPPAGFTLDPATAALPELKGLGNVLDLATAMTLDPKLKAMVQAINDNDDHFSWKYVQNQLNCRG